MQDLLKNARQIARSPQDHLENLGAFTDAWATLKAARGQSIDPTRLRPAYQIDTSHQAPEPTDVTLARISAKVRAIMTRRNITRRNAA